MDDEVFYQGIAPVSPGSFVALLRGLVIYDLAILKRSMHCQNIGIAC